MNIYKFTNQISIRTREISKRIQRALNELSENLQRELQQNKNHREFGQNVQQPSQHQHQPAYIPVPVNQGRNFKPFIRQFSTTTRRQNFTYSPTWNYKFQPQLKRKFHSTTIKNLKFFKKSKILSLLNHGFIYHNFSQIYQNNYSLKIYQQNVKNTYKILFTKLREKYQIYKTKDSLQINQKINSKLLLNLSLTSKNHHIITSLAKIESSAPIKESVEIESCFMDFPINFNFNIPNETILSEEIFHEMIFSIKNFEMKLKSFKSDLINLFDLGELPLKYIQSSNVIRIHFPNCDRERLEKLCKEKNISGGIIIEEVEPVTKIVQQPQSPISDVDILSSYNEDYSCTSDADILSNSSNELGVHLNEVVRPINEFMPVQQMISINDGDGYHWISSN
ncbi:hypothetical protein KGF54_003098 [Candida jiufengensis]|uniref:uncharacterized protein n=1 Tax=Candida jiufengensis TaxID=497108 RepID=UPI0022249468|nr:uncharacterized protein KGF54_003098 [Candida jiufengensis]KAI5952232.1 hypothetical protein KGF54_003098 [Candida jiufengensis]